MWRRLLVEILDRLAIAADPRLVEAWVRCAHDTLDALSLDELEAEVVLAVACMREAGAEESARLADTMGVAA